MNHTSYHFNLKNNNPYLSVWVLTYNHQDFILKCLSSIFDQNTKFSFNVVIGDDFSNDKTFYKIYDICKKTTIPTSIIRSKKNQWTKTGTKLASELYDLCKGKYVALCEGDDYWTDPYKLQKQVDYLEANPDCSFCFTDCQVERNKTVQQVHPNFNEENQFTGIDFADQTGSIAQTCTWLVRRECIQNLPKWVTCSYTADWCMQIYFSKFGKGGYIPESTAVYRIHQNGVWSKLSPFEGWRKNLEFYKTAIKHFKEKSLKNRLKKRIRNTIIDALELANTQSDKNEIQKWLKIKISKFPFTSISQSLHSLKLLSISTFQNKS